MKKFLIVLLVLMVVFSFSFLSCQGSAISEAVSKELARKNLELKTEIKEKDSEIVKLENELKQVKKELQSAQSELDKKLAEETEEQVEEPEQEEKTEPTFKESAKGLIEDVYGGKLTKAILSEDGRTITLAYNTMWAVEETIRREVFDITSGFAENTQIENLDISATSDRGRLVHVYNSIEVMRKLRNYEISYEEWLSEVF